MHRRQGRRRRARVPRSHRRRAAVERAAHPGARDGSSHRPRLFHSPPGCSLDARRRSRRQAGAGMQRVTAPVTAVLPFDLRFQDSSASIDPCHATLKGTASIKPASAIKTNDSPSSSSASGAGSAATDRRLCVFSLRRHPPPNARACSYALLGVEPDASSAAIKKAYHRLALEKHPDRNSPISQPTPTRTHSRMLTRSQERQYSRKRGRVPGARGGAQSSLAVLL